jgi:membrane-bound ClpP family serine protease
MPAIILEGKDGINSINRSFKLVIYNYWRVLGSYLFFNILFIFIFYILLIVLSIIVIIVLLIIFALFHINFNTSNNTLMGMVIVGIIFSIMGILLHFISSVAIAFNTCLFFNQKIKNENYGVEVMAEAMIGEAGEGESISETTAGDSEIKNMPDNNIQKEDQSQAIEDNESAIIEDKKEDGGSAENGSNQ